ncbi:uncharacterized protein LOC127247846 [Andrographis paniculata]|uniref:uncharacterized protein LOC127247846 n=1 Tax=Andrographis paniculata TaxID=175694 RepID=UPI0021E7CA6A|nr:uncharacterized protein LOC127247846 [Andrographis paniculata]
MEISAISDAISSIAYTTQSSGLSNFILNRSSNVFSLMDTSDQSNPSPLPFNISAVSRSATRTITKPRVRKTRRVKRKVHIDDGGEDCGIFVFSDGMDFSSGGGNSWGGGGGGGWNFGGHGWGNWEESSDNTISDPAFDFVFEILCWIAMSNCLHFAFKRVVRFVSDGFGDRGKVPLQLTQVC